MPQIREVGLQVQGARTCSNGATQEERQRGAARARDVATSRSSLAHPGREDPDATSSWVPQCAALSDARSAKFGPARGRARRIRLSRRASRARAVALSPPLRLSSPSCDMRATTSGQSFRCSAKCHLCEPRSTARARSHAPDEALAPHRSERETGTATASHTSAIFACAWAGSPRRPIADCASASESLACGAQTSRIRQRREFDERSKTSNLGALPEHAAQAPNNSVDIGRGQAQSRCGRAVSLSNSCDTRTQGAND